MRAVAAVAAFVALAAPSAGGGEDPPQTADLRTFSGVVVGVLDGDTMDVVITPGTAEALGLPPRKSSIRVRLYGIDAPESGQPFGQAAKKALSELVLRQEVVVAAVTQDDARRIVALVHVGQVEVNELMVKRGDAWAFRRYLGKLTDDSRFCFSEREARRGQLGFWRLAPKDRRAPWEYRTAQRGDVVRYKDFDGEMAEACVAAFEGR